MNKPNTQLIELELSEADIEKAKAIGNGNIAEGVRLALASTSLREGFDCDDAFFV